MGRGPHDAVRAATNLVPFSVTGFIIVVSRVDPAPGGRDTASSPGRMSNVNTGTLKRSLSWLIDGRHVDGGSAQDASAKPQRGRAGTGVCTCVCGFYLQPL
jgi:hypothetical protein